MKDREPESYRVGQAKSFLRQAPFLLPAFSGLGIGMSRLQEGNIPAGIAGLTGGIILGTIGGARTFQDGQKWKKNNEL